MITCGPSCSESWLIRWSRVFLIPLLTSSLVAVSESFPISRENLYVRDPYVWVDRESQTYYLYAAREYPDGKGGMRVGVGVHTSKDLESWSSGYPVFTVIEGAWAEADVWAPEMHQINDKYYLFVTLTSDDLLGPPRDGRKQPKRGTQIMVADSPIGPFVPFVDRPHTNLGWMTLDGTPWQEDGQWWLVYCHEWAQIVDGTMDLIRLKDDLSATVGRNTVLFKASDAPWVVSLAEFSQGKHAHGFITDGPWMHFTQSGRLAMIWSSFTTTGYAVGLAYSESGSIRGPWVQDPQPLLNANGGHGMIFRDLDGALRLALHYPNTHQTARGYYLRIDDTGDSLKLVEPFLPTARSD